MLTIKNNYFQSLSNDRTVKSLMFIFKMSKYMSSSACSYHWLHVGGEMQMVPTDFSTINNCVLTIID